MVQDHTEETPGETSTQRQQLELHVDTIEYGLCVKASAESDDREVRTAELESTKKHNTNSHEMYIS